MRGQIKLTTRRELTAAISQRYKAADRNGKKLILDEFVKVTGCHRKHAIRVLSAQGYTQHGRPVGHRIYQEAVKEALIVLWEASDRICGKRLKALLPLLVEAMERHDQQHTRQSPPAARLGAPTLQEIPVSPCTETSLGKSIRPVKPISNRRKRLINAYSPQDRRLPQTDFPSFSHQPTIQCT